MGHYARMGDMVRVRSMVGGEWDTLVSHVSKVSIGISDSELRYRWRITLPRGNFGGCFSGRMRAVENEYPSREAHCLVNYSKLT